MDRRTVVRHVASAIAVGVTGCVGGEAGDDAETTDGAPSTPAETDSHGGTETGTATDAAPGTKTVTTAEPSTPALTGADLTVTDQGCGREVSEAAIRFEDGAVLVEGTVPGADTSRTATLVEACYDPEADRLSVVVGTTEREDAGDVSAPCLVEIDYRVRAAFEGGLPGAVAVAHDTGEGRETVATLAT